MSASIGNKLGEMPWIHVLAIAEYCIAGYFRSVNFFAILAILNSFEMF